MWFRVDDKLWGSPKWLALKAGPRALWVTAGAWSMDQLTDGYVPAHVIAILGGRPSDARALIAAGLWEQAEGGYQFHDWHDWQPSRDSIVSKREAEAQRKAEWRAKRARERAAKQDPQDHAENAEMSQRDNDGTTASVPRLSHDSPAPVPDLSRSSRPDPTRPDPTAPKGATKKGATKAAPAPADEVATAVYEATSKMVKYIAVRNVAAKALSTGATSQQVITAMLNLYRREKPITLETVGQALKVAKAPRPRRDVGVDQWLA